MTVTKHNAHIADVDVEEVVHDAVEAACHVLDRRFPGGENDGITSNFAGVLEETIKSLLCGLDPRRGRATELPKLCND